MKRATIVVVFVCVVMAVAQQTQQQKSQAPVLTCAANPTEPCAKIPPKIIEDPNPEYTDEARKKGINATPHFSVVVGTDGKVSDITEEKPVGFGLDESAMDALKRWRFKPGKLGDGTDVPVRIKVEITFRLG